MSHRIQNNVGYKKIYPMSDQEDDTFCHYCGRSGDFRLALHWDHVPPLNIRIPEFADSVRKTLVRACEECNLAAGDLPHMSYNERHFWLKSYYLNKYKNIILKEGDENFYGVGDNLRNYMKNVNKNYNEILQMIGFGIRDLSEIESPVLAMKTEKGNLVSSLVMGSLWDLDRDDETSLNDKTPHIEEISNTNRTNYTVGEFLEFIISENISGKIINSKDDYLNWLSLHPDRATALQLPSDPTLDTGLEWSSITEKAKEYISKILDHNSDTPRVYGDISGFCKYVEFKKFLSEHELLYLESFNDFQQWHKENTLLACKNCLPFDPVDYYNREWRDILSSAEALNEKP